MTARQKPVGLVIPVLNETVALEALLPALSVLDPDDVSVLFVDGGSHDDSTDKIKAAGFSVISVEPAGRARQINAGVEGCKADLICVLHADTLPPENMARHIRATLSTPKTSLGCFRPIMTGRKTRYVTSFHNLIKTWYAPLLFRPHMFLRGGRLFFGDHAMFFRRSDFLSVGGIDETLPVMEEADLCIKLSRLGRAHMVWTPVFSSDRRVVQWGGMRANLIYLRLGILWGLGFKRSLGKHYPDIR